MRDSLFYWVYSLYSALFIFSQTLLFSTLLYFALTSSLSSRLSSRLFMLYSPCSAACGLFSSLIYFTLLCSLPSLLFYYSSYTSLLCPLLCSTLLKVTFDFDKFSREVHTKTTSMMVESSMNVCLIALSSILRHNSLNCLNTKKPWK